MEKKVLFFAVCCLVSNRLAGVNTVQTIRETIQTGIAVPKSNAATVLGGPLIGDHAPSFKAKSSKGTIHFPDDYAGNWVIVCGFPSDFTPVGETELKKLASMRNDFEKLHTKIIGISPDSKSMHQAWISELEKNTGFLGWGKVRVNFPIITDEDTSVAQKFGMIHPNESARKSIRSVFFIDPKGYVRTILHYPIGTGRNFEEIKRVLQSLQISDGRKVATAAEWHPSKFSGTSPLEKEYKDVEAK